MEQAELQKPKEHTVDSWGDQQLAELRRFFAEEARAGDHVVFDEDFARRNGRSGEGFDSYGHNSFMLSCANKALSGLDAEREKFIRDNITLKAKNLFAGTPAQAPIEEEPQEAPQEDPWGDTGEPVVDEKPDPGHDREAEDWARRVEEYNARHLD